MEYKSIVDQEMERKLRDKQVWDSFFHVYAEKNQQISQFLVPEKLPLF